MKRFFCVLVLISFVATIAGSLFLIKQQRDEGVSAVRGYVDNNVIEHVLAEYGDAISVEDLLWQLLEFACLNFHYNYQQADIQRLQWFDYMDFVQGKMRFGGGPYSGVCYDFAAYAATVVEIIADFRGWSNVRIDVASIESLKGISKHACNFIYIGDAVYYLDLTWDNTNYKEGRIDQIVGPHLLEDQTPQEYCLLLGYKYLSVI